MATNTLKKARKQISQPIGPRKSENSSGSTYNIWYNKNVGERGHLKERVKTTSRCNIAKDGGETKGSSRQWDGTFLCLKFARGCCPFGYECSWIHALPSKQFDANLEATKDCFGRERHENVRDDQSGVGSFSAEPQTARTLYVGGISVTPDIQSVVYEHFKEWGEIDNVRVLQSKGVAFVRYKNRSNAEFAREAMQNQSLDSGEILNVRWATDDPNPWVQKRKEEKSREQLANAILQDYDEPLRIPQGRDTRGPPEKRVRKGSEPHGDAVGYYPNTDYQYFQSDVPADVNFIQTSQSLANPSAAYSTASDAQPKTIFDLIRWSKEQALLDRTTELVHSKQKPAKRDVKDAKKTEPGSLSLASAYDSSSSDDETKA